MAANLRILFFSPKTCFPANTGARLRNYHLSRQLSRHAEVTYLAFSEEQDSQEMVFSGSSSWGPEKVILVPREKGYTAAKLVRGALGRTPLTVLNYTTRRMATTLQRVLDENDYDIVQIESLLLSAYIPILRAARNRPLLVCDWHNIDSEVLRRYSEFESSLARRLYARLTAKQLESLEISSLNRFAAHLTVSERDRQSLLSLGSQVPIVVADNGVDTTFYTSAACKRASERWSAVSNNLDNQRKRILFVGSMDYHANIDAVTRFVYEFWIDFHKENPDFTFSIVGRDPSENVRKLAELPGIEVTGTLPDVRPYYHGALASVVPLRIGGGSRLKILESMAAGVPVISTGLGAEGLALSDKENFLLAETKEEFHRALLEISASEGLRNRLAVAGIKFVRQQYDWQAIGKKVFATYEQLTENIRATSAISTPVAPVLAEVSA